MTSEALLGAGSLEAAIARRDGIAISRRQYLADAAALAERLPPTGAMLNLSLDRVRRVVGRQQAGVAAEQRCAEADGEPVAVDREVEHRPGRRQPLGEGGGVGEVLAPADRDAVAAGDGRLERASTEQRFARHGVRSAGAAWRRE